MTLREKERALAAINKWKRDIEFCKTMISRFEARTDRDCSEAIATEKNAVTMYAALIAEKTAFLNA